jgi:hypothetical protein
MNVNLIFIFIHQLFTFTVSLPRDLTPQEAPRFWSDYGYLKWKPAMAPLISHRRLSG